MAEALISVLLEQLASIIRQQAEQEVKLVVGVKKEVLKLTSNLETIQAVLEDAERRQVKEATVKQWLAKLKDVSYDMDDVLDEWNTAIMKMKIEVDENAPQPKGKVCSFIHSCFCYRQVALRRDISIKIKELNEALDVIANEKRNFDFTLMRGNDQELERKTVSIVDVSKVHGRDKDKNKVVNMLLSESSQGPTFHIISIVGMGGIGKTTLAQLVYNDDTVMAHFPKRIWVYVSDLFDEVRIAKAILEALTGDTSNLNELESLFQTIHQFIKGEKFLLVLDDVWTEDYGRLEQLKNSLKFGSTGSKILITTRKEKVAEIIGTTDMFQLGQLSDEECLSLLCQVAFSERNNEECKKLEDIGRKIVDKCKGLPLAARTLGSLLRFKKTREQWQRVLNSDVWKIEEVERGLFPHLLLSYYDMSSTMRHCFSYCAIFPKDYKLNKDELIYLWMAQGYLKATGNEEMEIIGEECFENLAMRSFFQDFERNKNGNIIRCKMHDIVHDFAQFLIKNECSVMEVSSSEEPRIESYEKARHLMMMHSRQVSIPIYYVNNLRSLIFYSNYSFALSDVGLPKLVVQLTCLRTLDLSKSGSSITEVLKDVGKLIHLRYLNLAYNGNLKELPETICDLCNLQSLNVSGCRSLEKLPHGLGKLMNLRHLKISRTRLSFIPKGVERLICLRTLDTFYVSSGINDNEASTIGDLKDLNNIRGNLEICRLGKVRDANEVKKTQLKNKEHLVSLILDFGETENFGETEKEKEEEKVRMKNDEQVIEAIQPPPNLEQLSILYYKGTSEFPNWMMSLTNLKKVQILFSDNLELLPPLGKLSFLESLTIKYLKSVKRVGIELLGIESEVNKNDGSSKKDEANTSLSLLIAFPKLEQLSLEFMYNLKEWDYGMRRMMGEEDITIATTIIIMPRLRSLKIKECPMLKALPDHLLQTTLLQELKILWSPILSERYYKERKGEDWHKISHIPNILINDDYVRKEGRLLDTPELYEESSSDSE